MREVERRARTAGGRVWALIRGNSRQHPGDADNHDDDDNENDNDNGLEAAAGGAGGGLFPSGRNGDGAAAAAGNGHNDAAAPEWVLSRLELMRMRRRGSLLNGDEIGPVRTIINTTTTTGALSAAAGAAAAAGSQGSSEMVTAESFGNLAALASAEENPERRETDEAVWGLRDAMEGHSAALSRLAGWMLQTAISPAIGNSSSSSSVSDVPMGDRGAAVGDEDSQGGGLSSLPRAPRLDSSTRSVSESSAAGAEEEEGVRAMLELSRESDVLEGRVKRERFRAHRAADEEIHRTPELYREACALGNALILKGHDYLSQVM